jgi:hypothetical protein
MPRAPECLAAQDSGDSAGLTLPCSAYIAEAAMRRSQLCRAIAASCL